MDVSKQNVNSQLAAMLGNISFILLDHGLKINYLIDFF